MSSTDPASLLELYNSKLSSMQPYIDTHAVKIIRRLKELHFQAYLVGGGVRDLLVDLKPKDFDIATNASPNEVKKKVSYSFIIGRRFKLVHAKRGDQIYEIATFRRAATDEELQTTEQEDRHLVEENFFGTIEEDSKRRDFTVNALFYDPIDHNIVDYCNGLEDVFTRTMRMIGDPKVRLMEDPVRILRAIRLSQKLGFTIEPQLRAEIVNLKTELLKTVLPRRREEWLKFFRLSNAPLALMELYDLGVFEMLVPSFHKIFQDEEQRENFLSYIRRFHYCNINFADPNELIPAILASYLYTTQPVGFKISDLLEDVTFDKFAREEFGVFKAELGIFFQAMQFIYPLQRKEAYLKKGERRQRSLVFHQSFLLSLKLGLLTQQLSAADILFWLNEREKFMSAEHAFVVSNESR
ncbi:poly(A) polymerase [Pseudobdellovibrio exovorus]|uniref:Poly(A) polymerase n=1 Tax=Pseudobdellovibrio exovorus JSS TaxID=1184267 RepID=M4V9K6_9BACT|nr:poly(A) polymerase [Pseudobdellovibrio exovorus]AGH94711.1 poly(A) polymerase [Pseudobdellovibrio exovorus JSS]